jgi:6-hydroxynicotinate 3-monooxygenase
MAKNLSIAIIGAGMGGLASAAALRRVGVDVTVYEQA